MAKAGSPWTKAEESFVRRNINKLTAKEMAESLERPVGGVTWKIQQLKKEPLKKPRVVKVSQKTSGVPEVVPAKRKGFFARIFGA